MGTLFVIITVSQYSLANTDLIWFDHPRHDFWEMQMIKFFVLHFNTCVCVCVCVYILITYPLSRRCPALHCSHCT